MVEQQPEVLKCKSPLSREHTLHMYVINPFQSLIYVWICDGKPANHDITYTHHHFLVTSVLKVMRWSASSSLHNQNLGVWSLPWQTERMILSASWPRWLLLPSFGNVWEWMGHSVQWSLLILDLLAANIASWIASNDWNDGFACWVKIVLMCQDLCLRYFAMEHVEILHVPWISQLFWATTRCT